MTLDFGRTSGYRQVSMSLTRSLVNRKTLHRLSCFFPRKKINAHLGIKKKSQRHASRLISSPFLTTLVTTRVAISPHAKKTLLEVLNSLKFNMFDMSEHRIKKP